MNVTEAAQKIHEGDLVVFPTETVYGLGALASNGKAVQKIFEVKGRPQHNPLILHIAGREQLDELVENISEDAQKLMDAFWPGPLTICFQKFLQVSDRITAGLDTVCVRCPDHPVAKVFLEAVGEPVAAPSANLSGRPSSTTQEDAEAQLRQMGVHFLEGEDSRLGLESTIVDCSSKDVELLRPGSISQQEIETVLGKSLKVEQQADLIKSPGQLLEHYSPQGRLTVIVGNSEQRLAWIRSQKFDMSKKMCFGTVGKTKRETLPGKKYSLIENEEEIQNYAAHLYQFLNWCDQVKAEEIILELPDVEHPLIPALMNRLEKASDGNIVQLK